MNLMDMLSSDGPDPMYQDDQAMDTLLDEPVSDSAPPGPGVHQPPNGVYYFPTILTNVQKDIIEICLKLFEPELLADMFRKSQKTKIHSLLGSDGDSEAEEGVDDGSENGVRSMSFDEKLEFIFDQIQTATKHPSLLVEHFLPKKLLLREISERFVNMSGNYLLFNRLVDSLLARFFSSVKLSQMAVYNVLVVAESVKELELIEGLVIGKELYYNNVSTMKLYDDNRGYPPHFNREKPATVSPDGEYSRKKARKSSTRGGMHKPILCLHLITTSQLYNNYTAILDPELSFKLIFSFDTNLDSKCPSIEMIRNQNENVYETSPVQIPLVIPVPVYSLTHIQTVIPKPDVNAFNLKEVGEWRRTVLDALMYNRFNIYEEEDEANFFIRHYGGNMRYLEAWLLDWESVPFPIADEDFMGKFTDKMNFSIHEDKLIKRMEHTYLLPIFNTTLEEEFKVEEFGARSFKAKFADILSRRMSQFGDSITALQLKLPEIRLKETVRQVKYDEQEETIATNYHKLRRLNEDANFVEKKHMRVDTDLSKLKLEKDEVQNKLNTLKAMKEINGEELDKKLEEQQKILEELVNEDKILTEELTKLTAENEAIRVQYQDSSNEALQLSVQIQGLKAKKEKIELKSNGPGIKILPSLLKKDDLINHEQTLKRLSSENRFLNEYFGQKLEKLINERKTLIDNSSSSSRGNNRVSRASTPY